MSPREALREGARILQASPEGCGNAFLDASLLLGFVLGLSREAVLAAADRPISEDALERYLGLARIRAAGRPLAYILGKKEFYGREFLVSEAVLVPRPDTELLVERALAWGDELSRARTAVSASSDAPDSCGPQSQAYPGGLQKRDSSSLRVLDLCTGSGALALSLAVERPSWRLSATDISPAALELARRNAAILLPSERLGGPVVFLQSDLFSSPALGCEEAFDLIATNPPYVPAEEARRLAETWGEPLIALDGGADGLDLCRRLIPEAFRRLSPGGMLLLEADPGEAAELRELFTMSGFQDVGTERDLAGRERMSFGRKPWKG